MALVTLLATLKFNGFGFFKLNFFAYALDFTILLTEKAWNVT